MATIDRARRDSGGFDTGCCRCHTKWRKGGRNGKGICGIIQESVHRDTGDAHHRGGYGRWRHGNYLSWLHNHSKKVKNFLSRLLKCENYVNKFREICRKRWNLVSNRSIMENSIVSHDG